MNKRVKKLWIAALKSGEYQQHRGRLRQGNAFCALGVLCDLHAIETGGSWTYGEYEGCESTLPAVVVEWAELDRNLPLVGKYSITSWNDGTSITKPKNLEQIANLIQRYL